jgi:hypothetical protein
LRADFDSAPGLQTLLDHLDSIFVGLLLSAELDLLLPYDILRRVLADLALATMMGLHQHIHVPLLILNTFMSRYVGVR